MEQADKGDYCPSHYGLEDGVDFTDCVGRNLRICHDCWLKSIKNVKFKGEDEVKSYSNSEVLEMLEKSEDLTFMNQYKYVTKVDDGGVRVFDEKGKEWHFNLDDEWQLIQQPVSFLKAVNSGKRIRVEHSLIKSDWYKDFCPLELALNHMTYSFSSAQIQDIILNGKWYIEDGEE